MAPVPGRDEACSHSPTAGPTDQGPRLHWEADSRGRGYRQSFQTTPAGEGNTARLPRVRRAARAGRGESAAFSIAAWAHALRVFQAVFRGRLDVSKRKGHWLPRKRYPPGVRTLWRFDYWNRAGGARPDRVLRLGVRRGRRKDPPWVRTGTLLRGRIPAPSEGRREGGRLGVLRSVPASTEKGNVPRSSDGGEPLFNSERLLSFWSVLTSNYLNLAPQ